MDSYVGLNPTPMKLFAMNPILLCQHMTTDWLCYIPTGCRHLEQFGSINRSGKIKDICFFKENNKEIVICLYRGLKGIYARNWSNQLLWSVDGAISGQQEIVCVSVATNGHGHLFVCDDGNKCIQLFSTDGLYIGRLVKAGEHGLGEPRLVRWCKKSSSLVIAHTKVTKVLTLNGLRNEMRIHISVMKPTF